MTKTKETELAPVTETGVCSICEATYHRWGNNAWPINNGRCCNSCNAQHVVPTRIANIVRNVEVN